MIMNNLEANSWVKQHLCPKCKNKDQVACVYLIRQKLNKKFKCYGYKKCKGK